MDQERSEGKPEIIFTNNFWILFLDIEDVVMKRVAEKIKLRMGDSWTKFTNDHASTYDDARAIVARYSLEYSPSLSRFYRLINEGNYGDAQALQNEMQVKHKDLIDEMNRKLTTACLVLESLGASRKDILG